MKKLLFIILLFSVTQKISAQQSNPDSEVPAEATFKLSQNYPNPAKENTSIKLLLHSQGMVSLKLYDMTGNIVSTLLDQNMASGVYSIPVETENIPDGIYFYVFKKGNASQTMKMIISK